MPRPNETELDRLFEQNGLRETLQQLHSEGRIIAVADDSHQVANDNTVAGGVADLSHPWIDLETTKAWIRSLPKELASQYSDIQPMDSGGFGVICRAYDKKLHRQVALKFHRIRSPAMSELATTEARAAARTTSPHIVQVHDVVSYQNDRILVLEWIDGWDLGMVLERSGPLSGQDTAQIAVAICLALEVIHENGHVHRDIKPGNVMLSRSGEIKVTDFGLADLPPSWNLLDSEDGSVIGTETYMAPEQRANPANVDGRADLYALAMTMFQLITGKTPPNSERRAGADLEPALMAAFESGSMRVRDRRRLAKLVVEMASSHAEQRPQTPLHVIERLQSIATGADLKQLARQADSPTNTGDLAKPGLSKGFLCYAAAMAVVIAMGWMVSMVGLDQWSPQNANPPNASPMAPADGNKFRQKEPLSIASADLNGLWTASDAKDGLQDFASPMQLLIDAGRAFLLIQGRLAAWGSIRREAIPRRNQDRFHWNIKGKERSLNGVIRLIDGRLSIALENGSKDKQPTTIDFSPNTNRVVLALQKRRSIESLGERSKLNNAGSSKQQPWLLQKIADGQSSSKIKAMELTRRVNHNLRERLIDPPAMFLWAEGSSPTGDPDVTDDDR